MNDTVLAEGTQTPPIKKKNDISIARLGLTLLAITFVIALALGYVNSITKDKIAQIEIENTNIAMSGILTEADSFERLADYEADPRVAEAYAAKAGGETVGYCFKVNPSGFGGAVTMIVGINADKLVKGVEIISHSETPGLGTKAIDIKYWGQYVDKTGPFNLVKTAAAEENDIVAVTGATITSTAIFNGVDMALAAYDSYASGTADSGNTETGGAVNG